MFGMSHEDFIRNQREMYYDRMHDAALQQVAEAAAAEGAAGRRSTHGRRRPWGRTMRRPWAEKSQVAQQRCLPAKLAAPKPLPRPAALKNLHSWRSRLDRVMRRDLHLAPEVKFINPVKVDKRPAGARSRSYAAKHSREKSSHHNAGY